MIKIKNILKENEYYFYRKTLTSFFCGGKINTSEGDFFMEKNRIIELLKELENNNQVCIEIEKVGIDAFFIALEEEMYDALVKLITPIEYEENGEKIVKILFDPFSTATNNIYEMIEQLDESIKKKIFSAINNVDYELYGRMKIGNTHARQIAGTAFPLSGKESIIMYFEPACLKSGLDLFSKNIKTYSNDTEGVIEDLEITSGVCNIGIFFGLLTPDNQKYIKELEEKGLAFTPKYGPNVGNVYYLEVPCKSEETVETVSKRMESLVSGFRKQEIIYKGKNMEEMMESLQFLIRTYASIAKDCFGSEKTNIAGILDFCNYFGMDIIYDEDTNLFWEREEFDFMKNKGDKKEVEIQKIVDVAYREIVRKAHYNLAKGNVVIPLVWNSQMSEIPSRITDFINEKGFGSSFVFSAYLIHILNQYGINAKMIGHEEAGKIRVSVLYEKDGKQYVANPTEDIEYFTENGINPEDRDSYYIGDTAVVIRDDVVYNSSSYALEEFAEKYGDVWLIGSMSMDSKETLKEQIDIMRTRCIAPPKHANYSLNR